MNNLNVAKIQLNGDPYEINNGTNLNELLNKLKIEKNKDLILIEGDLPSPINPPSGCVFRTRCKKAQDICSQEKPELKEAVSSHEVACHFHD